mgnify:CR=1 FL=1
MPLISITKIKSKDKLNRILSKLYLKFYVSYWNNSQECDNTIRKNSSCTKDERSKWHLLSVQNGPVEMIDIETLVQDKSSAEETAKEIISRWSVTKATSKNSLLPLVSELVLLTRRTKLESKLESGKVLDDIYMMF